MLNSSQVYHLFTILPPQNWLLQRAFCVWIGVWGPRMVWVPKSSIDLGLPHLEVLQCLLQRSFLRSWPGSKKTQPAYNKLVENAWLPNFGACHVFTPKDFQNIPELGATFHHFPGRWAARFNPYVSEARWKNSESASKLFRWNCFLGRLHHWPTKIAGWTRETMQSGWFNQQTEDILG